MTDSRLVEAEDLLDAVLADQYEGDDWVAIDRAHDLVEEVLDEQRGPTSVDEAEIEHERKLDERRERHFDRHGHFGPGRPDSGPD